MAKTNNSEKAKKKDFCPQCAFLCEDECIALWNNDFKSGKCPFYKTREQLERERRKGEEIYDYQ